MEPYWDLIQRIINESDLVLEVLDARLVELSRNEKVEELIKEINKPVIFVINKSDLVSKNRLKSQVKELKKIGNVIFISAKTPKDVKILLYAIKKLFKKYGKREIPKRDKFDEKPKYRETKGEIVVGVLGYPNVGKSSIINALSHKRKTKVSKKSGTTHGIHWIKATNDIKLIDSPGVIPLEKEDEIKYGLIGAKDTEALKNPELVAHAIIKLFAKQSKDNFEKFYSVVPDNDPNKTIKELSIKRGHLIKDGKPDEHRTCSMIVRDWQQGKLRL